MVDDGVVETKTDSGLKEMGAVWDLEILQGLVTVDKSVLDSAEIDSEEKRVLETFAN